VWLATGSTTFHRFGGTSVFRISGVYSLLRNHLVPFLLSNQTQEWVLGAEQFHSIPPRSITKHTLIFCPLLAECPCVATTFEIFYFRWCPNTLVCFANFPYLLLEDSNDLSKSHSTNFNIFTLLVFSNCQIYTTPIKTFDNWYINNQRSLTNLQSNLNS
jgi:hypothetical protein